MILCGMNELQARHADGGNSVRCVELIAKVLGHAGEQGQKRRRAAAEAGKITYIPDRKLQEMVKGRA